MPEMHLPYSGNMSVHSLSAVLPHQSGNHILLPSDEEAGPDGYITSESYLTEKRMEGGEV